jgi:hypothetical protein
MINKIKNSISHWLEQNQYKDTFTYKMSLNAFDKVSLDASTLAYDVYNIIGYSFTNLQKNQAVNFMLNCQNKDDGFFYELEVKEKLKNHPDKRAIEMSANYLTFQTIGALKIFGALPKYKISFYDKFIEDKGIKDYLTNNCPWDKSPWGAGGMIDNLGTILDCNIRMGYKEYESVLEEVFEWLQENQNNTIGFWGSEKIQGINGLINGGYHAMRGTYFLQNKSFNYPKNIIDNILKNISLHERFQNDAEGCHDLDHFYLLQKCYAIVPEYRQEEIKIILKDRLKEIMKLVYCDDGAFSFEAKMSLDNHTWIDVSDGKKESDMLGTVFYLQTIISIYKILNKEIDLNESKTHG